jgi:Rap1a immunity proteins
LGPDKKYMKERNTMKIKYCVVTLIIFFLMANTYVWAEDTTSSSGMNLLSSCEKWERIMDGQKITTSLDSSFDAGYCSGLINGISVTQILYSECLPQKNKYKVCWPKGTNTTQNIKVVLKYLREHPAELHLPDTMLIMKAFGEAYPCQ